mmetsp:Transcript_58226/g.165550  ORF Transcript_58226/g.165550 Transcript_58226/m.165550 type:complete len:369 (+) Transcript_58226:383-1489(+)
MHKSPGLLWRIGIGWPPRVRTLVLKQLAVPEPVPDAGSPVGLRTRQVVVRRLFEARVQLLERHNLWTEAADGHKRSGSFPRLEVVGGRPDLWFRIVLWQHSRLKHSVGILGVRVEVVGHKRKTRDCRRDSNVGEPAGINCRLVTKCETPPIAIWPRAYVFGGLHEPVHSEVAIKANDLDDVVKVLDDAASVENGASRLEPLHFTCDDLGLVEINGQEVDVTDAPPRVLLDAGYCPIWICRDREEAPRVQTNQFVHWLHRMQHHGCSGWAGALIYPPTYHARHHQVEVAGNVVHLGASVLNEGANVFVGKGAHANEESLLACELGVIKLMREAIPNLTTKYILTRPCLAVGDNKTARVKDEIGYVHVAR